MNLVITGAGGFLGRELLRQSRKLVEKELNIVAVSGQKIPDTDITVLGRESFFNDYRFTDSDVLINCAFPRNTDGVQMANGLSFIARLMGKAVSDGVGAVINISSQSVYSQGRTTPADEDTLLNLESGYSIGKYATELFTNSLCRSIPHTNLRMASLIGVGFDQRVVNKMVKRAMNGDDLIVNRSGRKFGFLDVRDAVDAILRLAMEDNKDWKEVYVLGAERSYTLEEIAELIREKTNCHVERTDTDEVGDTGLNSYLLYRRIHWNPQYSLQHSVEEIIRNEMNKNVENLGVGGVIRFHSLLANIMLCGFSCGVLHERSAA